METHSTAKGEDTQEHRKRNRVNQKKAEREEHRKRNRVNQKKA